MISGLLVINKRILEAKHRSGMWWERKDGTKVNSDTTIQTLLQEGVGKGNETALKLLIGTPLISRNPTQRFDILT